MNITEAISNAANLTELLTALNDVGNEINRIQQDGLDAGDLIGDYGRSVSECPTFGGDEPEDTAGVWSWDDTHLLVGEGWGSCELVARGEW